MAEVATKRIVLEHTRGHLNGLYRIIGLAAYDDYPPHIQGPCQITCGDYVDDHVIEFASLIRVFPRWCHYREVVDKSRLTGRLGDYTPGGRVGDLDPAQV